LAGAQIDYWPVRAGIGAVTSVVCVELMLLVAAARLLGTGVLSRARVAMVITAACSYALGLSAMNIWSILNFSLSRASHEQELSVLVTVGLGSFAVFSLLVILCSLLHRVIFGREHPPSEPKFARASVAAREVPRSVPDGSWKIVDKRWRSLTSSTRKAAFVCAVWFVMVLLVDMLFDPLALGDWKHRGTPDHWRLVFVLLLPVAGAVVLRLYRRHVV
jgi:hypothetical protein